MADEKNSSNTSKLSTPPPEKKVTLSQALADANATPTSPLGKALAAKKEHDTLPETPSSPPKSVFPFLVWGLFFLFLAFVVYGYTLFSKGIFHTTVDNPTFENISYILDGKELFLAPKETKKIFLFPGSHTLTLKNGEEEEKIKFQKPWNKKRDLLNPTYSPYVVQYVLIGDEEKYAHLLPQGIIPIYEDDFKKTDLQRSGNFKEIHEYYATWDWEYHVGELVPLQKTPQKPYDIEQKLTRYLDWYSEEDIYVHNEEEEIENEEKEEHSHDETSSQRSWITSDTPSDVPDSKDVQEWDKKLDSDNWFQELTQEYEENIQNIQQENIDRDEDEDDEDPWDWGDEFGDL